MQIIEATSFGVRSAIYHFAPRSEGPVVALHPMVHLAEPAFYAEISCRLSECDVILAEGIRSPKSSFITYPYRMAAKNPRLGLVLQKTMDLSHIRDRIVHADISGDEFDSHWNSLPFWNRLFMRLTFPVAALYFRFLATRETIARHLSFELLKSRDEILREGEDYLADVVMLNARDRHLIGVLEEQMRRPENAGRTLGVLYGAGHIRAVVRYLTNAVDYRVAKAEWTTVFDL